MGLNNKTHRKNQVGYVKYYLTNINYTYSPRKVNDDDG